MLWNFWLDILILCGFFLNCNIVKDPLVELKCWLKKFIDRLIPIWAALSFHLSQKVNHTKKELAVLFFAIKRLIGQKQVKNIQDFDLN